MNALDDDQLLTLDPDMALVSCGRDLRIIRLPDLLYTAATLMLRRGVHPKMASEMLGHSIIAITLDLYSPVIANTQCQAVDAMDAALADPTPG